MSGSDSSGEKSEKPTPRRLREARRRGQVARSAELASAASLLCVLAILVAFSAWASVRIAEVFVAIERSLPHLTHETAIALLLESMTLVVQLSVPPLAVGALVALVATALQVGPLVAFEAIAPKLERLDPVAGAKRMVSVRSMVQFGLMALKLAVVGVTFALIARVVVPDAIEVIHAGVGGALAVAKRTLALATLWCGGLFLLLGLVDLIHQRHQWLKELRMTLQEVRREHREDEGNPTMRALRRSMAQEPLPSELMQYVKAASCVIAEPGGRAVALLDRADLAPTPVVVLRGDADVAREILERARHARVRIVTDPVLLDGLYGRAVPGSALGQEVADRVRSRLGGSA